MDLFGWFRKFFFRKDEDNAVLPIDRQVKAWRRANARMTWGIKEKEFGQIDVPPPLTEDDRHRGFIGSVLFYGFADDSSGNSDAVLSGKMAWDYARKVRKRKIWQCEYVHFDEDDYMEHIRLRPGAPGRPKGFYYAKFQPGKIYQDLTISQLRKRFDSETGCGPEGMQFLVITHSHFLNMMNERKIPFMALADYDVAPYGYEDFFDAPQVFCSNGILGLGIGHVDRNYPLFGIPTVRFSPYRENCTRNRDYIE